MPVLVNVRLLERGPAHLTGEVDASEFAAGFHDEVLRLPEALQYDLTVSREEEALLVRGRLWTTLEFDCCRCLKTCRQPLEVPEVAALLPLEGEEAVGLDGDFADLTPQLREDTFLVLPTNPLCRPECRGLAPKASARDLRLGDPPGSPEAPAETPWGALDKLNL